MVLKIPTNCLGFNSIRVWGIIQVGALIPVNTVIAFRYEKKLLMVWINHGMNYDALPKGSASRSRSFCLPAKIFGKPFIDLIPWKASNNTMSEIDVRHILSYLNICIFVSTSACYLCTAKPLTSSDRSNSNFWIFSNQTQTHWKISLDWN